MKKFFALSILTVAAAMAATDTASAWWPCFPKSCSGSSCTTTIRLRQYNAFTPICCGTLTCDGCCPLQGQGCYPGACGPALLGMQCGAAVGYDVAGMGHLPMMTAPMATMQAPVAVPAAQSPLMNGQPIGAARPYYYYRPMMPFQPVQPVAYQAMYNPLYMQMQAQTPWYWGGR